MLFVLGPDAVGEASSLEHILLAQEFLCFLMGRIRSDEFAGQALAAIFGGSAHRGFHGQQNAFVIARVIFGKKGRRSEEHQTSHGSTEFHADLLDRIERHSRRECRTLEAEKLPKESRTSE